MRATASNSPYLPACKAFLKTPPPQQSRDAFEIIGPALEHRQECEKQIIFAIQSVEFAKKFEMVLGSPAGTKKSFRKKAKMLRQASEVVAKLSNDSGDQARRTADAYDLVADRIPVPKGSRRQKESKKIAVYMAHRLLTLFGSRAHGMTREGTWHQLAGVLYGDTDSIDFSYLRDQQKRNLGPHLFPSE